MSATVQTYEALRALRGRGTMTNPLDLAVGQAIRVDGMKYRVQAPPSTEPVTGSVLVEVYSEDNQHDVLSLSGRTPVAVLGTVG